MAWHIVRSPHDASEVKVRDQDLGRSVRDGQNRIFFLLQNSRGEYYGSLTREGGPDQEAAYDKMMGQEQHAKTVASNVTAQVVHDATGKGRGSMKGKLIALLFIGIIVVGAWAIFLGPLKNVTWKNPPAIESDESNAEEPKTKNEGSNVEGTEEATTE